MTDLLFFLLLLFVTIMSFYSLHDKFTILKDKLDTIQKLLEGKGKE